MCAFDRVPDRGSRGPGQRRTPTLGSRREEQRVGTETHAQIFIFGLFSDILDDKNLVEEAHEQIRLRMR